MLSPTELTAGLSLLSAAIWGTSDFVGGVAAQRIRSSVVVAISHCLSLLILVAIALLAHSALPGKVSAGYGLLSGLACGTGVMVLYKALALGSMGVTAAVSGVLAALLPVLFAFATEGLPHPRQWIGFAVAAAAIWMIAAAPGSTAGSAARSSAQGLILGVMAGISFGFLFILLKLAGRGGVLWPLACSRVTSASLAIVVSVMAAGRTSGFKPTHAAPPIAPGAAFPIQAPDLERSLANTARSGMSWAVLGLAAMAGVFDASGNSFYTLATRTGRLDIAAVLSSLYPASTILLAAVFLKERTTRSQAFGMVLALVAVVLISA